MHEEDRDGDRDRDRETERQRDRDGERERERGASHREVHSGTPVLSEERPEGRDVAQLRELPDRGLAAPRAASEWGEGPAATRPSSAPQLPSWPGANRAERPT